MERLSLYSSAIVTRTLEDGTTITARKIERTRQEPGDTEEHEARHAVAAGTGNLEYATNEPSGDSLGHTKLKKADVGAAAAPAAYGHGGIGHDMNIAVHGLGVDYTTALTLGRAALKGKEEEVREFAIAIKEKGTAYQSDLIEAQQNVINRRQGIAPAEIKIISPDGRTTSYITQTFRHEVKIADLLEVPSKAA